MPTMRLNTVERDAPLSLWVRNGPREFRCGNVAVRSIDDGKPWRTWYVYVRTSRGFRRRYPEQRPWGYGSAGQAKLGASLMAKYQKAD